MYFSSLSISHWSSDGIFFFELICWQFCWLFPCVWARRRFNREIDLTCLITWTTWKLKSWGSLTLFIAVMGINHLILVSEQLLNLGESDYGSKSYEHMSDDCGAVTSHPSPYGVSCYCLKHQTTLMTYNLPLLLVKILIPLIMLICIFSLQDHRHFQQRYYEFLDYFQVPDGPIFLVICGESSCNGISNDYKSVSCKSWSKFV